MTISFKIQKFINDNINRNLNSNTFKSISVKIETEDNPNHWVNITDNCDEEHTIKALSDYLSNYKCTRIQDSTRVEFEPVQAKYASKGYLWLPIIYFEK